MGGGRISILALGVLVAVALLAVAPVPTASADPIQSMWMILEDPTGRPFANETVIVAIWNETGNCAIAYFKGTTDENGNLTLTKLVAYDIYKPDQKSYPGTTYNITIAIKKYGRWLLLTWNKSVDWTYLVNHYINKTVRADHWWILNFSAWTDPDRDDTFDTPLYFKDSEFSGKEDLASFRIYWNDTRELITEIWAESGTNVAEELFNISDIEVEVTETVPESGCFVFTFKNVTLYKEVYWNLFENPNEYKKVLVGKELLNFTVLPTGDKILNVTDLVAERGIQEITVRKDKAPEVTDVKDYAYTVFFRVSILDPCGNLLKTGAMSAWKVFFQATIDTDLDGEEEAVILRSGAPKDGVAPARGYVYQTENVFWVPDITAVYGEDYNVTLNIMYYNVLVFTADFPTNATEEFGLKDKAGTYMYFYNGTINDIDAFTSVVATKLIIKDSQPTSQPLEGARVVIEHTYGDPIYTVSGVGGAVYLPPFTTAGAAEGATDFGRVYWSVYKDVNGEPYGYLPVPFTYRVTGMLYNYTVRIYWKMPGGEEWVDVTPADNVFALNITAFIKEGCKIQEFAFQAKVYHAKIRVIDLCGEPITSKTYPGATVIAYMNGKRIGAVGLGVDGTIDIGWVPAGTFRFRLIWKGIPMRANITEPEEPRISIEQNVGRAVTLVFPVGNVNITATMWDVDYPLYGLNVTIQYVKDGNVIYEEPWETTDCYGRATFTQVPLKPLTVDEGAGHVYEVRILIYTDEDTPYIRPQDANILVANKTITWEEFKVECWNEITVPTWIYSFKVWAVDHEGNVLKTFKTDVGDYPVTVVLNDTTYGKQPTCCPDICPPPGCVCPPPRETLVDFRIFNMTGPTTEAFGYTRSGTDEAKFVYYSQQFLDSDPEKDEIGLKPHMFVAGATYHFMVFHGGVLVYNYTITLPRPDETVTVFINETDGTTWTVEGEMYNYTWIPDGQGRIAHPIMTFIGAKSWMENGARADAVLKLVTWAQTLEVYTLSNTGQYVVPSLNVTLIRTDALNWTLAIRGDYDAVYTTLTTPSAWADLWTNYAWSAADEDGDGIIAIQVPVWTPGDYAWIKGITFGAEIARVYVLAGSDWGSINVPDTPHAETVAFENASEIDISHEIFGYVVNWNSTAPKITVDPAEFFPTWFKEGIEFRGNDTYWVGDYWNMTYWSGAAKVVDTVAMEGFCVAVKAPIDAKGTKAGLPNQPVKVTAIGNTSAEVELGTKRTDSEGTAKFAPATAGTGTLPNATSKPIIGAPVAYKFNVTGLGTYPEIDYRIETWQNFEDIVAPYGLKPEDVVDYDVLNVTKKFGEEHNAFGTCVTLEWGAILITVEDWSGKPLKNAMVAAIMYAPTPKAMPSTFNFTDEDGFTILLVPPNKRSRYEIKVFWRDSYLLAKAGAIPRSIDIYSSYADETFPRFYGYASGAERTGTIKTFVYVGLIQLLTKEGKALSPEALSKITVTITWPDKTVTRVKPGSDGVAPIIMNKDTVVSWPHTASAKYSPESPHPQSPPGEYSVVVEWEGVGKIAEKTFRIHRARLDVPEVRETVYVDVTDVEIVFRTPFDTPVAGAAVTVTKPDGTTLKMTTDSEGKIVVPEVPLSKVDVTVETWKGFNVGYKATGVTAGAVTVENIGKLVVTVVGARGQGLAGAKVTISGAGSEIVGTTDASGKFAAELPAGSYTVKVEKGGKTAEATATVSPGPAVSEAPALKLDIFMTIAGWEMSFGDFVGLILLVVVLVIVLFIIAHEYAVWRRRRIARAIVPAKPEGGA